MSTDPRTAGAIDREVGALIRTRRLELGMSQERLAELLGVTFQQVQKYEKGVNRVAFARMLEIAKALNATLAAFVPSKLALDGKGKAGARPLTPGGYKAAALFDALDPRQQQAVMTVMEAASGGGAKRKP